MGSLRPSRAWARGETFELAANTQILPGDDEAARSYNADPKASTLNRKPETLMGLGFRV